MSNKVERTCPLCMEEMDLTDQQLKPCKCGYEICVWCWHHIIEMAERDDTEGLCPACRTPYDKERIVQMTISSERLSELSEKQQKRAKSKASEARKSLSTVRVIQRNLVYIAGVPVNLADEETLRKKEFLGQYGKVLKVVITRTTGVNQQFSSNNSCSVYITFSKEEEALRCILVVDGYILDGRPLRACFGTTKYCHAWLRNMSCFNPDCPYLHDTGMQEDTCTKDVVISACASKLQQSSGISWSKSPRRSGSFFPPPIDYFCSNSNLTMSKPLVQAEHHSPSTYGKYSLPNGDSGKSSVLPTAASWGSRVNSGKSSYASVTVSHAAPNHPSVSSGSLPSSPGVKSHILAEQQNANQSNKQTVTSRNQIPLSDGLENFLTLKPYIGKDYTDNSLLPHIKATIGTDTVIKDTDSESSCFSTDDDLTLRIIPAPYSLDSDTFNQLAPIPLLNDAIRHSTVDKTRQASTILFQPVTSGNESLSGCLDGSRDNFCSAVVHPVNSQDTPRTSLESISLVPACGVSLAAKVVPPSHEQCNGCSDFVLKSATNFEAKDFSLLSDTRKHEDTCISGTCSTIMGHEVGECSASSAVGVTISPEGEKKLDRGPICYGNEDFEPVYMERRSEIPISSGKDMGLDSVSCNKVNAGPREDSIISDILSLDLGIDDPLINPHNLAKVFGDADEKSCCSNIFKSWMSCHSNESRFSFARVDDSYHTKEQTFSLHKSGCAHEENSDQLDIVEKKAVNMNKSLTGLTVYDMNSSEVLNLHPSLSPPEVANESQLLLSLQQSAPSVSGLEVSPSLRCPAQNRTLQTPGIYPQQPDQGAAAQHQFWGNPPHMNFPRKIAGRNSYADVELIDAAIMALGRGELPQSTTQLISSSYGSNLAGFSAIDQSLWSKSRSGNLTQYDLVQNMALQEAARNTRGSWGSCNMGSQTAIGSGLIGRRDPSELIGITNSERATFLDSRYGSLRSLREHEEPKFQSPNSSCFYNSPY